MWSAFLSATDEELHFANEGMDHVTYILITACLGARCYAFLQAFSGAAHDFDFFSRDSSFSSHPALRLAFLIYSLVNTLLRLWARCRRSRGRRRARVGPEVEFEVVRRCRRRRAMSLRRTIELERRRGSRAEHRRGSSIRGGMKSTQFACVPVPSSFGCVRVFGCCLFVRCCTVF